MLLNVHGSDQDDKSKRNKVPGKPNKLDKVSVTTRNNIYIILLNKINIECTTNKGGHLINYQKS